MATNLKLKKKCHIVPPEWLSVDFLQERLTRETSRPEFSKLPFRFAEIAKVILDVASDDVQNADKIKSLLKDLREARQAKSRDGLQKLDHSELSLPNLCSMEINEIRPFFIQAMGILTQLVREPSAE
jgi:GINS complex subunit 2